MARARDRAALLDDRHVALDAGGGEIVDDLAAGVEVPAGVTSVTASSKRSVKPGVRPPSGKVPPEV